MIALGAGIRHAVDNRALSIATNDARAARLHCATRHTTAILHIRMSILNDTAEYAVRAALYIAQHGSRERPTRVDEIAQALGIPRNYLSKIMHTYVRSGVMSSITGPQGGFWLAIPAAKLPLIRLVEPFDPIVPRRTCILGRGQCSDRNPCPAHTRWRDISESVVAFFRRTTVEDLLKEPGTLI